MKQAVIVSAVRTAVGKAPKGTLRYTRPDDLGAVAVKGAVERVPSLDPKEIEDVIIGCAMPEGEQGMNVARLISLRAGLPVEAAAMTVNRYCASGLQTIALAAERIRGGGADVIVAGGTESMSYLPMGGNKIAVNPWLIDNHPAAYMSMGLTAERVAKHYGISREESDEFALGSHQKALAAIEAGHFQDEIVPVPVVTTVMTAAGKPEKKVNAFRVDEGPRADTSIEALAKLRAVFHAAGVVTAGNSSQTSDGAAAVVVMSDTRANEIGAKPLARFVSFAYAGCLPEEMGIGPVYAIPKALKLAGLTLDQIDLIELNEAFAAQSLAVCRDLRVAEEKVNVFGGAIALGHPIGASGARVLVTLVHALRSRQQTHGVASLCIGGGMGIAVVLRNGDAS
jgi:acetyl-CoA acyltransferase